LVERDENEDLQLKVWICTPLDYIVKWDEAYRLEDEPQRRSCGSRTTGTEGEAQWGPADSNINTLRHGCLPSKRIAERSEYRVSVTSRPETVLGIFLLFLFENISFYYVVSIFEICKEKFFA
jgi:hypothetical protein